MAGFLTMNSLSASLEELSLKKQLPLRQQKDKPMLKYSNSAPGPSSEQMLSQAEILHTSTSTMQHSSGDPGNHSSSVPSSPSKFYAPFSRQNSSGNLHYNSNGRGNSPIVPSTSNPYARPLSAKDIVQPPNTPPTKQKSGDVTQQNGFIAPSSPQNVSNSLNSFLRPHSGIRVARWDSNNSQNPPTNSATRKVSQTATSQNVTGLVRNEPHLGSNTLQNKPPTPPSKHKPNPGRPLSGKKTDFSSDYEQDWTKADKAITHRPPSAKKLSKKSSAGEENDFKRPIRPASARKDNRVIVEKVVRSPSSSDRECSDKEDIKKKTVTTKHVPRPPPGTKVNTVATRPPSAITRPISALSRPGSAQEIASKVRNAHYTPSKPYSEVCNTPNSPQLERKNSEDNTSDGSVSDTPTLAPKTLFYHKESKSAGGLGNRSGGDGAPAKTVKLREKSAVSLKLSDDEVEEWEDEGEEDDGALSVSERQPGDGEAFDDLEDDDDDEAIDNLDDDDLISSDDESLSDDVSMSSSASRHSALNRLKSAVIKKRSTVPQAPTKLRTKSAVSSTGSEKPVTYPGLTSSLFSKVPPTITFIAEGEQVEQLPWDIRKLFKWRMCSITPNIVKNCIARSGFRPTKKSNDWLGCWGKHMKALGFKSVKEYQKLNHFPGSFQIGRKDRLWRNLFKMQVHFGKKEFSFFPLTYVLPFDLKQLKRAWEDGGSKQKWIIKPPASARGIGIRVVYKWNQIPKRRPVIVQKYLAKPYLINDSKFDMRVYVYVSCYDPLRVYVFEDGLTRLASQKYSNSMKSLCNKYMHLTNYSINKKNSEYQSNSDDGVCQGHKWSLKSLWGFLKKKGIDTRQIWDNMKDLIVKTIISSESPINSMIKANVRSHYSVHELFGFDIMLDENLKPWVLEVNISPSLHSNSQLDINVKGQMIKDLHNIAGFRVPNKNDVMDNPGKCNIPKELVMEKRLYAQSLAADERAKHAYYCQKWQDEDVARTCLDVLTPDDLRVLIESIDEDSRKGGFQRAFPTAHTHNYMKYFEAPRYWNILLDQWMQKYHRTEARGVAFLDSICLKGIHLQNPTSDPYHQWCPPSARAAIRTTSAPIKSRSASAMTGQQAPLPKIKKKLKKGSKLHHASSVSSITSTSSLGTRADSIS